MPRFLIIYTGGTFGMVLDKQTQSFIPSDIEYLVDRLPELNALNCSFDLASTPFILDSSDIGPQHWVQIANLIESKEQDYDGFVVLHGTDTMAYTASALSFLLNGLNKTVILTGAQIPLGYPRSDARENLISSLQLLIHFFDNEIHFCEVAIFFRNVLLRGNRTTKVESEDYAAFESHNFPVLGSLGIHVKLAEHLFLPFNNSYSDCNKMNCNVAILPIYPNFGSSYMSHFFNGLTSDVLILESYGTGNVPNDKEVLKRIQNCIENGVLVLNRSQCLGGVVYQKMYETGNKLEEIGVIGLKDMSREAALTKSMWVASNFDRKDWQKIMLENIYGEITV